MENMYYIGLDVHKRTISYCVKDVSGRVYAEASLNTTRHIRWDEFCMSPLASQRSMKTGSSLTKLR